MPKKPKNNYLASNMLYMRCKKHGLSRSKLAIQMQLQGINITDKSIEAYENGRNEPSIDMLKQISRFFDLLVDDLCFVDLKAEL